MSDRESTMLRRLGRILDHCHRIQPDLLGWGLVTPSRPDVSNALLEMLYDADELVQAVNRDRDAGEWVGMPPETIVGLARPVEVVHADHPEWDFGPWLGEKLTSLKTAVKTLVRYYCFEVEGGETVWEGHSQEEFRQDAIQRGLSMVDHYARVVYDQIYSNRLKVDASPEDTA